MIKMGIERKVINLLAIIFDFGFIVNLVFILIYMIAIFAFPFVKIGPLGLKQQAVMRSEEIWHKVHVIASLSTIPFLLLSIAVLFIENWLTKSLISLPIVFMAIFTWNVVAKVVTKDNERVIKLKEQKDLEEQIKKESGWR